MARLPYLDAASASPAVRETLERLPPLNIFKLVAHAETAAPPFLAFGGALLSEGMLDGRLRELAILRVATLTPGAEYEWVQHVPLALANGATQAQVDAVAGGRVDDEALDEDARLVLAFTEQVVRDATPDDPTWERISARLSAREIVELLLAIGLYMTLARVMATARIDIEPPAGDALLPGA